MTPMFTGKDSAKDGKIDRRDALFYAAMSPGYGQARVEAWAATNHLEIINENWSLDGLRGRRRYASW